MKINVDTRFKIGETVYFLDIEKYSFCNNSNRKGFIHKSQISAIRFYDKDKYEYELWRDKYIDETQLYKKLADAQQAAIERGYTVKGKYADIKYIG